MNVREGLLVATYVSLFAIGASQADELNPARRDPSTADAAETRIIVKLRSTGSDSRTQALMAGDSITRLAERSGVELRRARNLTPRLLVVDVDGGVTREALDAVRADVEVEYAEPDRRRYLHALPNDPLFAGQWYLQARAGAPSAVDAEHAWDTTTGSGDVVIAVLDTGVLFDHPDLGRATAGGRLLPGFDFISNTTFANDGDGRDADPSDPGDFVTQTDKSSPAFAGCSLMNSSWHGTRVAGIIAARTGNSEGIAGSTWSPWILPVRVLGKCGGYDSDILAAMLWAAGISVAGVPDNLFPAHVENLSFGSSGGCTPAYREVIDQIVAAGTLVVVSAGNEGGPVAAPANCSGTAAVAGLRHAGTKVGYSSLGPEVAVSAPAGNCVNTGVGQTCLFSIDTAFNRGTTSPGAHGYTDQIDSNVGTSFSAPIVAGIAGLMMSLNANLGPAAVIQRLREGAAIPFPASADATIPTCHLPVGPGDLQNRECNCTTSTCGAGMANAPGALAAALRPVAAIAATGGVSPGQNVTLSAAGSAAANGRTIGSYSWSIVCGPGVVTTPSGLETSVIAPATGSFTVLLEVVDDLDRRDIAAVVVTPSDVTPVSSANACPVVVAVSPATVTVQAGGTQSFVAMVSNATDQSVVWSVDGVVGGSATVGSVSSSGLYAAPGAVPVPATVTLTAVSNQDPSKSGSASITITAAVQSAGGGGGGAALDLVLLLCLIAVARRRR